MKEGAVEQKTFPEDDGKSSSRCSAASSIWTAWTDLGVVRDLLQATCTITAEDSCMCTHWHACTHAHTHMHTHTDTHTHTHTHTHTCTHTHTHTHTHIHNCTYPFAHSHTQEKDKHLTFSISVRYLQLLSQKAIHTHSSTQHSSTQHSSTQLPSTQHPSTQHPSTQHPSTQHSSTQHSSTHSLLRSCAWLR